MVGQPLEKIKVVNELIADSPHIRRITKAMLEINVEFASRVWESKVTRPDSQGKYNLLEIREEDCPEGGKHILKTKEVSHDDNIAWCEKCGNQWFVR